MLKGACIHPEIMRVLALCGHGDKVLITDANYPLDSKTGDAAKVYLGLCPGTPTATQVLDTLSKVIAIEKAEVMLPEDGSTPGIFAEFCEILGDLPLDPLGRYEFYDECCKPTLRLAILAGEKRVFANVLLTIGVV